MEISYGVITVVQMTKMGSLNLAGSDNGEK